MLRPRVSITVLLSILFFWCSPATALEPFDFNFPRVFKTPPVERIDTEDLETFLDDFFAREMERLNIPGAVFSMVENGEIVFSKGYGFANLADQIPADPEKTLFRAASISKLFTATAAMQLYEQGLLDLEEDVNVYLDCFQLEEKFDAPITMFHLLTHTAGFDDRSVSLAYEREDEIPSLEDYLAANMPPRVRPPGEVISYSNHGLGLAGLVVEKISGQTFVNYVNQNILEPLGMARSSFLLPPELAPDIATGYFFSAGVNQPRNFDYLYNIAPAASLITTADDMTRFMIAHLQKGRFERARILREETADEMQSQQFAHHQELDGICYGFFENYFNGRRFIHHSGLWGGFASLLFLYPDGNLGFFVSLNSDAGTEVHGNLAAEFAETFLPAEEEEEDSEEDSEEDVSAMAVLSPFESEVNACIGRYRPVRYARHSLEKIAVLTAQCQMTDLGPGGIAMNFSAQSGLDPIHWAEAEPFFFKQAESADGLAFRQDEQGRVTHLFLGTVAMERLAWYEDAALHRAAGFTFLALFLSAWAGWPLLWAIRRRKPVTGGDGWRGRWPAATAALLNTIFLAGFLYYLTTRPDAFIYGVPPAVIVLLILPLAAAALTISSLWVAAGAWSHRCWTLAGRLHYSLVVLSLLLFIPFLHYWNLLGFRF